MDVARLVCGSGNDGISTHGYPFYLYDACWQVFWPGDVWAGGYIYISSDTHSWWHTVFSTFPYILTYRLINYTYVCPGHIYQIYPRYTHLIYVIYSCMTTMLGTHTHVRPTCQIHIHVRPTCQIHIHICTHTHKHTCVWHMYQTYASCLQVGQLFSAHL